MKSLWKLFASLWLTIILAILICLVSVWGSLISMRYPEFFRALDAEVLFPWLLDYGFKYIEATLWIYILVVLVSLFALNTTVCTADKLFLIWRQHRPWQSFFPHIVHIGFLIALLGHLAGSVWGFRSYGNVLFLGEPAQVPNQSGLLVRLDDVAVEQREDGQLASLKTKITLLSGDDEIKTAEIGINSPLIYKGIAFYHMDQGSMPSGLVLDIGGEQVEGRFNDIVRTKKKRFRLGHVYPDFAYDESGKPVTMSQEYRNPHIEILSEIGDKGYLDISRPGASIRLGSDIITLKDYRESPYVVLTINKDPGIWLIIAGSIVLVAGMLLLLFMRGDRGELVKSGNPAQ